MNNKTIKRKKKEPLELPFCFFSNYCQNLKNILSHSLPLLIKHLQFLLSGFCPLVQLLNSFTDLLLPNQIMFVFFILFEFLVLFISMILRTFSLTLASMKFDYFAFFYFYNYSFYDLPFILYSAPSMLLTFCFWQSYS
jgi:hypothetical protein